MNRLLISALVAGAVAVLPHPTPADAQDGGSKLKTCIEEAKQSCDGDFPGDDWISTGIRGWCYTIRTAWCYAFDPVLD